MVEGDGGGQRTTPSADQECPVPHAHRIGHDDRVQRYMVNGVGPNFEMNQVVYTSIFTPHYAILVDDGAISSRRSVEKLRHPNN